KIHSGLFGCAIVILTSLAYTACDDSSSAVKERSPDAGGNTADTGPRSDSGGDFPDGAPEDCYDNPTTHFEIINACTTATRITKNPTLTKLLPDGGLPPLN
ncbi:MAG: hypothetical protein K0S65_6459, partial [Labilithrix sp.]|nr:hypothetical protein [Labilithrix sp.]